MRLGRFILCALATAALLCSELALAATKTWIGPFSGGSWSTGGNWSPFGSPSTGDTVVFNSPVTSTADLSSSVTLASIEFGPNSGGSTISGTVRIKANLAGATQHNIDDKATGGTNTITANIILSGGRSWFTSRTGGHTLELRGTISGTSADPENGIRIYGPGIVKFNHNVNNTYAGTTTVNSADSNGGNGLLQLAGNATSVIPGAFIVGTSTAASSAADRPQAQWLISQVLADTSSVTVGPDGLLALNGSVETIAQLTGTGTVTSISTLSTLTVGDTGNFTWGGVISGAGNVNKVGTGTMTYAAANTYTGLTTVSNGTLVLNAGDTIQAIQGPLTIGDGIGAANTAIVQIANWFQIESTSLPLTINSDGKLENGLFRDDLGAVTLNGGNIVLGAQYLRVRGGLTMNGGTITATGGGELWMASNVVATSTAPFGAASINATVAPQISSIAFTVNSGSTQPELTINGAVILRSPPSLNLVKTGSGTLRLAGTTANTYGGSTTIEQGVLELAKPDNVAAISGPIVIGNNTDPAGSATLRNLASNQLTTGSAMLINASGQYDLNGSVGVQRVDQVSGLSGSGSVVLPNRSTLQISSQGGTSTFHGLISSPNGETTATNIDKREAGTQVFTANNTYAGVTRVSGGTLVINGQQAGAVSVASAALSGSGRVGAVALPTGAVLEPGAPGMGGTLSTGPVNLDAAFARLSINLISSTVFGKLNVTGTVTLADNRLSLLPAPGFVAPVGTIFEIVTNDGADPVVGTFGGLPQGATVSAGSTRFTLSYTGGSGNDITLTVNKNTLDIDGDGKYLAETDGLLIRRFIQNLAGPALTANAVAYGATRTTDADILAYLQSLGAALDVNNSAGAAVDATDALFINRWMLGFRGESLVSGTTTPPNFGDRSAYITSTELTLSTRMP